jgi:hypothetical protein
VIVIWPRSGGFVERTRASVRALGLTRLPKGLGAMGLSGQHGATEMLLKQGVV